MHRQCVRLVVEEAIRSKCRADVHDEVVYRTMTLMHKISLAFKQLVNALDDISFPEHNLFFNRHEFVLYVRLESMYEICQLGLISIIFVSLPTENYRIYDIERLWIGYLRKIKINSCGIHTAYYRLACPNLPRSLNEP